MPIGIRLSSHHNSNFSRMKKAVHAVSTSHHRPCLRNCIDSIIEGSVNCSDNGDIAPALDHSCANSTHVESIAPCDRTSIQSRNSNQEGQLDFNVPAVGMGPVVPMSVPSHETSVGRPASTHSSTYVAQVAAAPPSATPAHAYVPTSAWATASGTPITMSAASVQTGRRLMTAALGPRSQEE